MSKSRRGRGEGSINQRKNGTWYAQLSIPSKVGDKRNRITISGPTKKYVAEQLRKEQSKLDLGRLVVTSRMTVEAFFTYWQNDVIEASSLSGATKANYARNTRLWIVPIVGKTILGKLTTDDVNTLLRHMVELKKSDALRQLIRTILSSAMKHAIQRNLILTNPCAASSSSRPSPGEFTTYDAQEAKQFMRNCEQERLGPMWQTAIQTGMRLGELLALKPADVDLDKGIIHVRRTKSIVNGKIEVKIPKTKKSRRSISLGSILIEQLKRHFKTLASEGNAGSEWVFCDPAGEMMDRKREPRSSFRRLMAMGLPRIRVHDLRHTHATLLLADGENPKVVSERLGHATVAITLEIYCHVNGNMRSDAADRLNRLLE